jgi:hypothetical protein
MLAMSLAIHMVRNVWVIFLLAFCWEGALAESSEPGGVTPAARTDAPHVGRVFWLYRHNQVCLKMRPRLFEQPKGTAPQLVLAGTTKVRVVEALPNSPYQWYSVELDDERLAYTPRVDLEAVPPNADSLGAFGCALPIPPDQVEALVSLEAKRHLDSLGVRASQVERLSLEARQREARALLPGVKLGMRPEDVRLRTAWGPPVKVNRTTTAAGTREQWVYGGGGYLYFERGRLVAIQH